MDFLYFILGIMLSMILFSILFNGLNMSALHLFMPLQNFTRKLKRKKICYIVTATFAIFLSLFIKDLFLMSYMAYGILLGFLVSLVDTIFENGIKQRES